MTWVTVMVDVAAFVYGGSYAWGSAERRAQVMDRATRGLAKVLPALTSHHRNVAWAGARRDRAGAPPAAGPAGLRGR
ncbi:hypothetical protein GCM10010345_85820 [Streptomyces canarius]|uniref:Uncharacterized protein n=1 Tax=Streptomyces canarius TaxID=285453 RepID=A0ABQ3DAH2_9ACTN|nr:hypothetical protein GCM10010345_85820 [Streptomyces canarius]